MGIDVSKMNKKPKTLAEKLAEAAATTTSIQSASSQAMSQAAAPFDFLPAASAPDKIGIVFDDSGSMHGKAILDAQEGCIEFMRNCTVNFTAVAIIPMKAPTLELSTNLPELSLHVKKLAAIGSDTPLYTTIDKALAYDLKRIIAFSDGQPSDRDNRDKVITKAIQAAVPIDTVYIHSYEGYNRSLDPKLSKGYLELARISEQTGGYCILYDASKTQFKSIMKHLTSGNRKALAANSAIADLESGRTK